MKPYIALKMAYLMIFHESLWAENFAQILGREN